MRGGVWRCPKTSSYMWVVVFKRVRVARDEPAEPEGSLSPLLWLESEIIRQWSKLDALRHL